MRLKLFHAQAPRESLLVALLIAAGIAVLTYRMQEVHDDFGAARFGSRWKIQQAAQQQTELFAILAT